MISYPRKTKILQSFTYQKKPEEPTFTEKIKKPISTLIKFISVVVVQFFVFLRTLLGLVGAKIINLGGQIRRNFEWFLIFEIVSLMIALGITYELCKEMEMSFTLAFIKIKKMIVEILLSVGCPRIDLIGILFPID